MAVGDIVISVSADISPLQAGVGKGVTALAAMEKSGKALALQLDKIGEAGVRFQQQVKSFAGVADGIAKSARSSADAFAAFDTAQATVDRLRASFDPVFAASKRYEAAVRELDAALEMGVLSGNQHAQMLDRMGKAYLVAGTQVDSAGAGMDRMGGMTDNARMKLQQVGFQVQDFAVQVGAGTSATQSFAQQFPQLASAFGLVGIALGTLAAIAVPVAVAAFAALGKEAKDTGKANDAMGKSLSDLQGHFSAAQSLHSEYVAAMKAGNVELMAIIELEAKARQAQFNVDKIGQADALEAARASQAGIRAEHDATAARVAETQAQIAKAQQQPATEGRLLELEGLQLSLDKSLEVLEKQKSELDKQSAAYNLIDAQINTLNAKMAATGDLIEIVKNGAEQSTDEFDAAQKAAAELADTVARARDAAIQLAGAAPGSGWMDAAIAGVDSLITKLRIAAAVEGQDPNGMAFPDYIGGANGLPIRSPFGSIPSGLGTAPVVPDDEPGGTSGTNSASGGGTNPLIADLAALQDQLASQAELEQMAFDASQLTLQSALDQRMLTMTEYQTAMEKLQADHQGRMSDIDVMRYGDSAQKMAGYMGVLADTFQSGNERMQKMGRVFGASEALINAWRAFTQTMADPTLPFFAKFSAGAAVLSAGMQAVNAIKSGSTSTSARGAGGAASAAASGPASTPLDVRLTGFGPNDLISGSMVSSLLDRLSAEAGDRGYRIMTAA